mgnify:CR=1 FL=1
MATVQKLIDFSKALLGYNGRGGRVPDREGGITTMGETRLAAIQPEKEAAAITSTPEISSKALEVYGNVSSHIDNLRQRAPSDLSELKEIGTGALTSAKSFGGEVVSNAGSIAKTAIAKLDSLVPPAEGTISAPNMVSQAEHAKAVMTDPEVQAAIKKTLALYGEALGAGIQATEPEMNEIIEQLAEIGDDALKKTTIGAVNSAKDAVSTAVSVIPGGGIVIAAMEIGDLINVILFGTIIPWLQANNLFFKDGLPALTKMKEEAIDKYGPQIASARADLSTALEKVKSKAQGAKIAAKAMMEPSARNLYGVAKDPDARQAAAMTGQLALKGSGKGQKGGKKRRKKAARTMRRLKKTLNRFANPKVHGTKKRRRHRGTRKNK